MASYVYIATNEGVGEEETGQLLRAFNAIWCPPAQVTAWHVQDQPKAGDRLWLLWAENFSRFDPPLLLGGGNLLKACRTRFGSDLLWTNADAPGIRTAAAELGHPIHVSNTFLRVERYRENSPRDETCLAGDPYVALHNFRTPDGAGLNQLKPEQEMTLQTIWPLA